MRFAVIALLLFSGGWAYADLAHDLLGTWTYDGFFYQSHRYPNPNPDLKLNFTFNSDHSSRLIWKRDGEKGFCERMGTWDLNNEMLTQTVTWVNPHNDSSCSQDPDMQVGRVTENYIAVKGDEFDLFMEMDGQEFIYILKRNAN